MPIPSDDQLAHMRRHVDCEFQKWRKATQGQQTCIGPRFSHFPQRGTASGASDIRHCVPLLPLIHPNLCILIELQHRLFLSNIFDSFKGLCIACSLLFLLKGPGGCLAIALYNGRLSPGASTTRGAGS